MFCNVLEVLFGLFCLWLLIDYIISIQVTNLEEIMCKCICETTETKRTPQPGEVWLGGFEGSSRTTERRLIIAIDKIYYRYVNITSLIPCYLTNTLEKNHSDVQWVFMCLDPDQSHNIQLPNQTPKPLRLEVGKVYETKAGTRVLITSLLSATGECPIFLVTFLKDNENNYKDLFLPGRSSTFTITGSYIKDSKHVLDLVRLSSNQSREIVL